jgi:hypothetical protein
VVGRASNSTYGAPNMTRFPPTQSRQQGIFVLLIYGSGNSPLVASDDGAVRVILNDGFRWYSFTGNGSDGDGDGRVSSSK